MTDPTTSPEASTDELVERLKGYEGRCPFCGRDPYHYVDIGVGMQAAAVVCCDLGIGYYQHGDDQLEAEMKLRAEAAHHIQSLTATIEQLRTALEGLDRAICFSAYSALEPLSIRFDFATADDRIKAADALDEALSNLKGSSS